NPIMSLMRSPRWLLGVWLWWLCIGNARTATFKLALIGPWSCDPLFSRAMPATAANLALSWIHRDVGLSKGYWYDVVLLEEDCSLVEMEGYGHAYIGPFNPALCHAATLMAQHWEAGLASPGCLNSEWPSLPPITPTSQVLFAVLRFFRWAHVGVISAPTDLWEGTGQEVASALRALGIPVGPVVTMGTKEEGPKEALKAIREADQVKVVILCMSSALIGGEEQRDLLLAALDMGMVSDGYVFIPYDALLYAMPYQDTAFPLLANSSRLRHAYSAVLTVTMASDQSFYDAFRSAQQSREIRSVVAATEVSPLFGSIVNMVYFVAKAVEERRQAGGGAWVTGNQLAQSEGGFEFRGFNQKLYGRPSSGGLQSSYVVLDIDGDRLVPTHVLEPTQIHKFGVLRPLARSFSFPGGKPPSARFCWFSPDQTCAGGLYRVCREEMVSDICGASILRKHPAVLSIIACVYVCVCLETERRVHDECRRGQESHEIHYKKLHSVHARDYKYRTTGGTCLFVWLSVCPAAWLRANPSVCLKPLSFYWLCSCQGDWVWLKRIPEGREMTAVNQSTKNLFSSFREMRHENLSVYVGLFLDSGIFAMVTEHCPRGSLADLLADSSMRLDWMFKSSLLTDLIKGMKYLHMHRLTHGRLKSRNCVVDERFVLKVSDYGLPMVLHSQNLDPAKGTEDLLWTAPELLRQPVRGGTYAADVFSFSIIIQEVVSRTLPYAMLDMPDHEIVERLRNPPPLCRPLFCMDIAPAECLSLMTQCWDEDPGKRPTFHCILRQFRGIHQGKKPHIIDSMLRMLEQYSSNLEDLIKERTDELEIERKKTDKLISQLLPESVARSLKLGNPVEPEHYADSTLYFSDIVGFTTISALSEPIEVVDLLNDLYTLFDAIIASHDVYKVETIGDAYMVASGVPNRNGTRHAAEVSNMSLDILHCIGAFKIKHMPEIKVKIRIGLHSGPVVAGVVGHTMPRYCLFGDTVTQASHLEATGLRKNGVKGAEDTFWLGGRDGFTKPLPVPPDLTGGNHGISLDEIPPDRRQRFLDRQNKNKMKK
uniref:Guanylate cyclase n=1 Tax=Gadus morhua TaxID=8049 RepID=A0A8C5CPA3_GADMO